MSTNDPDIFNTVDTDEIGDIDDDGYVAPDEPMASHAFGTTPEEEREGETFNERDKHTEPEVSEADLHEDEELIGRVVQDGDEDIDAVDDEASAVALVAGMDDDLSAEEQAMHITDS